MSDQDQDFHPPLPDPDWKTTMSDDVAPRRSIRSMIATIGAHEKWARCEDRTAATEPMRRGFEARFLKMADPDGKIQAQIAAAGGDQAPEGRRLLRELTERIAQHRKAYFMRLALKSAQVRAAKRARSAE